MLKSYWISLSYPPHNLLNRASFQTMLRTFDGFMTPLTPLFNRVTISLVDGEGVHEQPNLSKNEEAS
jgi:hypothetical protein